MIYWLLLTFSVTFLWQLLHFYLKGSDHVSLAWAMQAWGSPTHEIYRYLTHGWMHSTTSPWHLFLNLLGVLYLGRDLEKRFSTLKILTVFFLGILLGALFWRWLPSCGDYPKWRLIGCSAGVCAWFAWELLEIIRSGKKGEGIGSEWLLGGTVLFELICWKMGWLGFIAHSAHLGGLLAGALAFIGLRREEVLTHLLLRKLSE